MSSEKNPKTPNKPPNPSISSKKIESSMNLFGVLHIVCYHQNQKGVSQYWGGGGAVYVSIYVCIFVYIIVLEKSYVVKSIILLMQMLISNMSS